MFDSSPNETIFPQCIHSHEEFFRLIGKRQCDSRMLSCGSSGKRYDISLIPCREPSADILEERYAKNITTEEEKLELHNLLKAVDTLTAHEMHHLIQSQKIFAPQTNNELTFPEPFHLMFATSIGPGNQTPGFLRPETAQGIYVNFKKLYQYNGSKLPFACAQIGTVFRNEISPRSSLLRVREFTLAEIEYFVHPKYKSHPKFFQVENMVLKLYTQSAQKIQESQVKNINQPPIVETTIGEAVRQKWINNEILGYFMGRTFLFLVSVGIHPDRIRFRQHLQDEMAFYACDCWDAEIHNSYGWVETVGIADRSTFDLNAHSSSSHKLTAFVPIDGGSKQISWIKVKPILSAIEKQHQEDKHVIAATLSKYDENQANQLKFDLSNEAQKHLLVLDNKKVIEITADMVQIQEKTNTITGENITPGVIEPSFGIGRILYSVLEHCYSIRGNRVVLSFPPAVAPIKVAIFFHAVQVENSPYLELILSLLSEFDISSKVDESSASIGKKYARMDELGVPFALTVDSETLPFHSVTLRERDSMDQVRVQLNSDLGLLLHRLSTGRVTWEEIWTRVKEFPHVSRQ
jgi:glycyl-tRNA synthetase